MVKVRCKLKNCESNDSGFCTENEITIQIYDPSADLHECYDLMPRS